ncbi:MAG: hypothetical protein ABSG92_04240 [Conexivisphaerales archaeon]|jgi:hypothetical protein
MQKAAVRRLLSGVDFVGSAALVAIPLVARVGAYTAFPGVIGMILSAASFYWDSGDIYRLCTGATSLMLFGAFAAWGSAFWGTYSAVGDNSALGLSVVCVLVAVAYLLTLLTAIASKDQK